MVLVWGVSPRETQKDVGEKVVDAMADPQVGMLVVLDHPSTPRKGSKQEAIILKALSDAMNVDNWVIPQRDTHVCFLGMLDKRISNLEVIDNTLDHNVVLAKVRKIQNKKKCTIWGN